MSTREENFALFSNLSTNAALQEVFPMTRFLAAGFLREDLKELHEGLAGLRRVLDMSAEEKEKLLDDLAQQGRFTTYDQLIWQTVGDLLQTAARAHQLVDDLPSDPLIYTGDEATDQLITKLEWLLHQQEASNGARKSEEVQVGNG